MTARSAFPAPDRCPPYVDNPRPDALSVVFPGTDGSGDQVLVFDLWLSSGHVVALEAATAFAHEFRSYSPIALQTARRQLNKLRLFVEKTKVASLSLLSEGDMTAFATALTPVASTRVKDWSVARRVIAHACRARGHEPPLSEDHPWARKAEAWVQPETPAAQRLSGAGSAVEPPGGTVRPRAGAARSRLAAIPLARMVVSASNVTELDPAPTISHVEESLEVFFPARGEHKAHRQDFSDWLAFDPAIAMEVARTAINLKRSVSPKGVTTWRRQSRKLLAFLKAEAREPGGKVTSIADLTELAMLRFLISIDKGAVATRSKVWRTASGIVKHVCLGRKRPVPYHARNPWPGHGARGPTRTTALTVSTVAAILRACSEEIAATMQVAQAPSYVGATLAELFPFVVALTFWTLFNPEVAYGIRRDDIRTEVLGRFAIVGRKGRSPDVQVATFPSSDDHLLAPKKVIGNLLTLTAPLLGKLPPGERVYLLVGRVREEQRAKALVQTYATVAPSMISFYRDAFCGKHGLDNFNLQQIRTTGAVICNRLFGGDQKITQVLMNHLDISTTETYAGREARRIGDERLADQMEKRNRWARSGGTRDVRDLPSAPQNAATPGFVCADPFDPPPQLGQERGGLCAAYGACPTCPLASVDRRCGMSLALVLRLRNQLLEAHGGDRVQPHRWSSVWKPRLRALEDRWLPSFEGAAMAEAAAFPGNVPTMPLPPIEEF